MSWRALAATAGGVLLVVAGPVRAVATQEELSDAEVTRLVREFVTPGCPDSEARAAVRRLASADAGRAAGALKAEIRSEATRSRALQLGATLRVPGLFQVAKPYLETADADRVVALLLRAQDKGATRFLYDQWRRGSPSLEVFRAIDRGFRTWAVDVEILDLLRGVLDADEVRIAADARAIRHEVSMREAATKILEFQLAVAGATSDSLRSDWKALRAAHQILAAPQRVRGLDVLRKLRDSFNDVRWAGPNCRVAAGRALVLPACPEDPKDRDATRHLPEWLDSGRFTLWAWVYVPAGGEDTRVSLETAQGAWTLRVHRGDWVIDTGEATRYTRAWFPSAWAEVRFIVEPRVGAARYARGVTIEIDGANAAPGADLQLNGQFRSLSFIAGGKPIAVSAVGLERR